MANKKQDEELFINKTTWTLEVKHEVEIHEFLKKISDDKSKKNPIEFAKFNLGGVEMAIRVYPEHTIPGFIGVGLYNISDQDQMCSASFKTPLASGVCSWERSIIRANKGLGYSSFLSHDGYKKWAQENGDVFKLEVSVSLRTRDKETVAFSSFGKTIMEDDSTADFTIRCKSKAFKVHKNFFCARLDNNVSCLIVPLSPNLS